MATAVPEPVLEVSGIRKRFGAVTVLDGVRLTIRPGEIHALMGENGAEAFADAGYFQHRFWNCSCHVSSNELR